MKYFISICLTILLTCTGNISAEETPSPSKNTRILRYKFSDGEAITAQDDPMFGEGTINV